MDTIGIVTSLQGFWIHYSTYCNGYCTCCRVGTTATAEAVVSAAGTVSLLHITNAGAGYTSSPTITIGDPSLDNSGNFKFNEIVTGSITGVKGRVRTWNATTNVLEVANVSGMFSIGEDITGRTSGAVHAFRELLVKILQRMDLLIMLI